MTDSTKNEQHLWYEQKYENSFRKLNVRCKQPSGYCLLCYHIILGGSRWRVCTSMLPHETLFLSVKRIPCKEKLALNYFKFNGRFLKRKNVMPPTRIKPSSLWRQRFLLRTHHITKKTLKKGVQKAHIKWLFTSSYSSHWFSYNKSTVKAGHSQNTVGRHTWRVPQEFLKFACDTVSKPCVCQCAVYHVASCPFYRLD